MPAPKYAEYCSKAVTFSTHAAREAWSAYESQGLTQPGTNGWWKVWGARVVDIRPGDMVLSLNEALNEYEVDIIEDLYLAKNAPLYYGVIINGQRVIFGALSHVIVLRPN